MTTLLLTIHILIAVALVGTVLLQRNEGGGLGIGGSASGGFMTARGTANLLTRITAILAACFFATSIGLAILAGAGNKQTSIVDEVVNSISEPPVPASPQVPTGQ
jgi:preprotein translocase subunit SecG